jgi:hypothetical protein
MLLSEKHYCSAACSYKGRRKGKVVHCHTCNAEVYKIQKALKQSKSGKFFCSKSCQAKWRNQEFIGSKHSNWKTGRSAYRSVLGRNGVPKICTLCATNDGRVLAVHHIDRDRLNNELSNLAWLCHNCHFLVHHDNVEKQRFEEIITRRNMVTIV